MGHASVGTTMVYVHHVPQNDAAARLSRLLKERTDPSVGCMPGARAAISGKLEKAGKGDERGSSGVQYPSANLASSDIISGRITGFVVATSKHDATKVGAIRTSLELPESSVMSQQ